MDWNTRKQKFALEGHRYPILGVSFSPDGKTLASAGGHFADGGEVKLWDACLGQREYEPDSATMVGGVRRILA